MAHSYWLTTTSSLLTCIFEKNVPLQTTHTHLKFKQKYFFVGNADKLQGSKYFLEKVTIHLKVNRNLLFEEQIY